jgi:hypothetical protein
MTVRKRDERLGEYGFIGRPITPRMHCRYSSHGIANAAPVSTVRQFYTMGWQLRFVLGCGCINKLTGKVVLASLAE